MVSSRHPLMARLGMIVPSSNTVVETVMPSLLPADFPVSVHISRLRVRRVASDAGSTDQFRLSASLAAASLLADAEVDLILWNGTAASWLGFERDDALVRAVEAETGIPALTAVKAINQQLQALGARRIGLVTPYVAALEASIVANYRAIAIDVVSKERLDLTVNTDYAKVAEERVAGMVDRVAEQSPDAIVIMCTNLAGARVAEDRSRKLGIPVLDSVATAVSRSIAKLRDKNGTCSREQP
jgi:maleate isomerase